jgi:hypothetical protein
MIKDKISKPFTEYMLSTLLLDNLYDIDIFIFIFNSSPKFLNDVSSYDSRGKMLECKIDLLICL